MSIDRHQVGQSELILTDDALFAKYTAYKTEKKLLNVSQAIAKPVHPVTGLFSTEPPRSNSTLRTVHVESTARSQGHAQLNHCENLLIYKVYIWRR